MRLVLTAALLASGTLFATSAARAAESYDNCAGTITSLPATITTQGVWCMKADLATALASGTAITVAANNVTIDCNHFKLGGLGAGPTTLTYGIRAQNRANLVVRNCNVRGFYTGAYTIDGSGHLFEDNRFEGNTDFGLTVFSANSTLRRNLVIDTGGRPTGSSTSAAISVAYGTDVLDNSIKGAAPPAQGGDVVGIYSVVNDGGTINGNRISGVAASQDNNAWGILDASADTIIDGNFLIGVPSGLSIGIQCSHVTSTVNRNAIVGFSTLLSSCTAIENYLNPN